MKADEYYDQVKRCENITIKNKENEDQEEYENSEKI